ncbi:MAG: 2,3-bisphosphoglycerate-dependent phosphoglycerate mutase [Atopobiaceae bacterium]|jgi:2,3-bisphosphoglycerate-dependent phosphoglycerate mutase
MSDNTSGARLVVMRHGESVWTDKTVNKFAGWVDVPLTEHGRSQARYAGELMRNAGIFPDALFTSVLRRTIVSADIVLDVVDRLWIPTIRTWRLNERHYGAFQGQTRPAMREKYGDELFRTYRRSFDVRPPEISVDSPLFTGTDERYQSFAQDGLDRIDPREIRAECLKDVIERLTPFWQAFVIPCLLQEQTVLVVTHGSVVRSLIKVIEDLTADEIRTINVPCGVPLVFDFKTGSFGGLEIAGKPYYLDPQAAAVGIQETIRLESHNPTSVQQAGQLDHEDKAK